MYVPMYFVLRTIILYVILYYYIMGKIVPEGNISNYETGLRTRGKAEGLINW